MNQLCEKVLAEHGYESVHQYLAEVYQPTTVLAARGKIAEQVPIGRTAPFTCVEMVKHLLGIDKRIYTPKALHDYIISHRLDINLTGDLIKYGYS